MTPLRDQVFNDLGRILNEGLMPLSQGGSTIVTSGLLSIDSSRSKNTRILRGQPSGDLVVDTDATSMGTRRSTRRAVGTEAARRQEQTNALMPLQSSEGGSTGEPGALTTPMNDLIPVVRRDRGRGRGRARGAGRG